MQKDLLYYYSLYIPQPQSGFWISSVNGWSATSWGIFKWGIIQVIILPHLKKVKFSFITFFWASYSFCIYTQCCICTTVQEYEWVANYNYICSTRSCPSGSVYSSKFRINFFTYSAISWFNYSSIKNAVLPYGFILDMNYFIY